jgi:dTDP-4-dehydrorhamnose reductase
MAAIVAKDWELKHKMKILITGVSGQIGKHLTSQLKNSEHSIIALDHRQLDIIDSEKTFDVMQNHLPDLVINLAAYTAVDLAEENIQEAFSVNHVGAENVSKAAAKINAAIIHLSTDYVFSGEKESAYDESDTPDPINIYGKSKLAGEIAVATQNPKHIILRTSWVFSSEGKNFFKTMLGLVKKENDVSVVSDQIGGPTYAGDIATAIIKISEESRHFSSNNWGIYHYSGTPYVSWYEFTREIFQQVKLQDDEIYLPTILPIASDQYPGKANRPRNSRLNNQKIISKFDIQPCNWRYKLQQLLTVGAINITTR